jgi:TPR repeat protein
MVALAFLFAQPAVAASDDALAGYDAEVKGDYARAQTLYRVAAMAGDAYAQNNLGSLYYTGRGVPKNLVEAMKWFRMAADKGNATARNTLGTMYERGEGIKANPAEAAKWYRLAAEQGMAVAQNNLGILYASGNGVPMDRVQAHLWFMLASKEDQTAQRRAETIAARMTPEQVAEANKLAKEFKPKS